MEGLDFAFYIFAFICGSIVGYIHNRENIRAIESRRHQDRINRLEEYLRWEKARGDAFLYDIQRKAGAVPSKPMSPESRERALKNGWGYVLGDESPSGQSLNQDKKDQK